MIYNKKINGVKFTFVCECWNTSTSWGHKVTLYRNENVIIGSVKIRYYNRTWERYQFQSAIKNVIFETIERITGEAKAVFKNLHNYKILTKKRTAEFVYYLSLNSEYKLYNELLKMF